MQENRQIIEGKPYFGMWFGSFLRLNDDSEVMVDFAKESLKSKLEEIKDSFIFPLEIQEATFIVRPSLYFNHIYCWGTVGLKYIIWGRAYQLMSLFSKKKKQFAKKMVNGKRGLKKVRRKKRGR